MGATWRRIASLVERCGLREKRRSPWPPRPGPLSERIGRTLRQAGRNRLAQGPVDHRPSGIGIRYIRRRSGWCLTTKLPVRDRNGKIIGVVGVSRDLRAPGEPRHHPGAAGCHIGTP